MQPRARAPRNRGNHLKSPRATLAILILLVAVVAALASLEFNKVSRLFYAQIVESESRGVRDRLSAHLLPALTSLGLTSRLLTQAQTRGFAPDSPEMLKLSTLTNEASVDAATLLDAQGVAALAARLPDGYALYVRPGQDEPQGKSISLDKDMRPLGQMEFNAEALRAMAADVAHTTRLEPRSWPAWTGIHPLPGSGVPAVSMAAPAGPDGDTSQTFCFSFSISRLRAALEGEQPLQDVRPLLFTPSGLMLELDRAAQATDALRDASAGMAQDRPQVQGAPQTPRRPQPPAPVPSQSPAPGPAQTPGMPPKQDQASSQAQAPDGHVPLFVPLNQVEDPARAGAMSAWLARGKPVGEVFSFQSGGETWWAALQPLADTGATATAGLVVPERALLSLVITDNRTPLLLGAGVLCVLGLLALLAVQLRRRGRAAPGPFFETEREILNLLAQGEGESLEFKSTLRFNLASGKPGKEIELACLKTLTAYMNTEGGILAVGVNDQGQVVGLEADGFENDDHLLRHFCSMFAQHIGTEFMRLVRFALRTVGNSQVLIVECLPSAEPVFLLGPKEEEFYVRAGPSSRRLSLSEFHRRVSREPGRR